MRKNRTGGPRLTTGGQPKGRRMVATFPLRQLPNPGHNPGASESIDWTIRLVCHDEEIIVRLQVRAQRTPRRSEGRNSNRGKMLRAVPGHGRDEGESRSREAAIQSGSQTARRSPRRAGQVRIHRECHSRGNAGRNDRSARAAGEDGHVEEVGLDPAAPMGNSTRTHAARTSARMDLTIAENLGGVSATE